MTIHHADNHWLFRLEQVSDYNNISPDSFTTTAKGTSIIRLVQQKTHTEVKIPIMNPNLKAICDKYNYNLPSVVDVILNRYIKKILKALVSLNNCKETH